MCTKCENVGMAVMLIASHCNFNGKVYGNVGIQQDGKTMSVVPIWAGYLGQGNGNNTGIEEAGRRNETGVEGTQEDDQVEWL
jgi:hypothetical protein